MKALTDEASAVDQALRMAAADDLVLMFGDDIDRTWRQITTFDPADTSAQPRPQPAPTEPAPAPVAVQSFDFSGHEVIRDERGVHLAKSGEEGDD